ncbi:insulin-like growth factor-binding protein 3 [Sardina pilchardus]|uniref:insulin-like growth factor-binding protein 3 n=1 Tax=Sardina pilchardus TaxID=27697 RepID=UPI002E11E98C
MTGLCALFLTALLAAFTRFTESVGPVVRCEPCDSHALTLCKPLLPRDCSEPVREPGCGCCLTCALREGQACGVYTSRCGSGLRCRLRPHETRPLQALLEGRGVCTPVSTDKTLTGVILPTGKHDTPEESYQEEASSNLTMMTVTSAVATVAEERPLHPAAPEHKTPPLLSKLGVARKEKNRKSQSYRVESVGGDLHTDTHNFSLDTKRETEYGPCRREMESVLKSLKITNVLNPRGVHIPNCDRRGFYKKKQCRPSKGRRRGYCWCVDKYGQRLPGYDGRDQGSSHCHSLEKK